MTELTQSDVSLVLRTDFTSDATWGIVKAAIVKPDPQLGFHAHVEFIDDAQYDGVSVERVLELFPEGSNHTFIFIVDDKTIKEPEHPVLCVDLFDKRGRSFRVIPSEMWGVENNLSIANMDFADFADNTDADGVFRGFPQ